MISSSLSPCLAGSLLSWICYLANVWLIVGIRDTSLPPTFLPLNMVNGPVRGRCSSVSARMCLWVSHMEISAGILGLLHYIDGYLCHWRIRVHSCEHMWAGAPRSTMYQCVSVEVGVTESGLGWAKWSRMKHVFCAEWDWIKRPTYRITSPQPLHITSPMHTIPYAPPPPTSTSTCPWSSGRAVNQRSFPQSVCLHK